MIWNRVQDRRVFTVALVALVIFAWVALFAWDQSPYARLLDHGDLADDGVCLFLRGLGAGNWQNTVSPQPPIPSPQFSTPTTYNAFN